MASSVNFLGSYSGIDQTTIDKLMAAEKLPLVQLANKQTAITAKQNAWKDINTRLNSLFDKIKVLQNSETFTSKKATSSNESVVSMTASKNATSGTYQIHVEQLASSTSVVSGVISFIDDDSTNPLGIDSTFTIANGDATTSADIIIEGTDTLKDIVNKINNKSVTTSVSATIIDNRLVLTNDKMGNRNITLTDENGGNTLDELGLGGSKTVIAGTDAKFTINGVQVIRDSNTVSDVVEGTTINLGKSHTGVEYDTVKVELDTSKLTTAVQEFVDQYNSTMSFIESKLAAGDPKVAGSAGSLSGDGTLMRLHASLRNLVTSSISNDNTDIKDISKLGVTTVDKYGMLQFDATKLTEAMSKDTENVMNFFTSTNSEDKEVGFASRIKTYVDSFISSTNGIIKGKTESFDETLKDLTDQIDRFNARMVKKEAYYIKKFSALDVALMKAESQMSWLEGQITSMNASSK